MSKIILLTGGAGFIASHVVRLLANKYPTYKVARCHFFHLNQERALTDVNEIRNSY